MCFLPQEGDFLVRTHHVEYCDGGILDPDDVLTDLVEDRDKVTINVRAECQMPPYSLCSALLLDKGR